MDDQEEFLISYCNLKSGLFNFQENFLDEKKLNLFYINTNMGFPICLPANIKYFNYKKASFFKINKIKFSKKIFNTDNLNYPGNKKFFRYGNLFAYNISLKSKYIQKYNFYMKNILKIKKEISVLKKKYKNVCAMQIRNVPHFGHEAVFKFLLKKFNIVVLNPIFGIKKKMILVIKKYPRHSSIWRINILELNLFLFGAIFITLVLERLSITCI